MAQHAIRLVEFAGDELGNLRAIDFDEASLSTTCYDELDSGKGEDLKAALKANLRECGQKVPALVLQAGSTFRLVDGHHRGVRAMEDKVGLMAEVHECNCASGLVDSFGLCVAIWARVRELQAVPNAV